MTREINGRFISWLIPLVLLFCKMYILPKIVTTNAHRKYAQLKIDSESKSHKSLESKEVIIEGKFTIRSQPVDRPIIVSTIYHRPAYKDYKLCQDGIMFEGMAVKLHHIDSDMVIPFNEEMDYTDEEENNTDNEDIERFIPGDNSYYVYGIVSDSKLNIMSITRTKSDMVSSLRPFIYRTRPMFATTYSITALIMIYTWFNKSYISKVATCVSFLHNMCGAPDNARFLALHAISLYLSSLLVDL